jgi:CHAT domain-containing protein/tetratricopeptide (TPR) repeat protein
LWQRFRPSREVARAGAKAPARPSRAARKWIPSFARRVVANPYFRTIGGGIVLAGLGFGIWVGFIYKTEVQRGIDALNEVCKTTGRPFSCRVTLLGYFPVDSASHSSDQTAGDRPDWYRVEMLFARGYREDDAASCNAEGVFYLTKKNRIEAIKLLRAAVAIKPNNARYHNDLGAALMEQGVADQELVRIGRETRDNGMGELDESLAEFQRALELDPNLPDPVFNRCLCHQYLDLPRQTRDDWKEYLERDPGSGWAAEAKENLGQIEAHLNRPVEANTQIVQEFLDAFQRKDEGAAWQLLSQHRDLDGCLVENQLLDTYLRDKITGNLAAAAKEMSALDYAADLEMNRAGDRYEHDLINWYKGKNPGDAKLLADTRDMARRAGRLFIDASRYSAALDLYKRAERSFEAVNDTCEMAFARFNEGCCYVRMSTSASALGILEPLLEVFRARGYGWSAGQSLLMAADASGGLGDYSKAIDYARHALESLQPTDDGNGIVRSLCQLGLDYRGVGKKPECLGVLLHAIHVATSTVIEQRNMWTAYTVLAGILYSLKLSNTALEFYEEALGLIRETGDKPLYLSSSLAHVGLVLADLHRFSDAIGHARSGLDMGRTFPDAITGKNMVAYSALAMGEIYRRSNDLSNSTANYDEAEHAYRELDLPAFVLEALKGKLLVFVAEGDDVRADEAITAAMSLLEQSRSKIAEESNSDAFFDGAQDIYDLAIDFKFSRLQNPTAAYNIGELSRARSFWELIRGGCRVVDTEGEPELIKGLAGPPLSLDRIRAEMPSGAQIVEYSVLPNKVIIWVVSKEAPLQVGHTDIVESDLDSIVARYLTSIRGSSQDEGAEDDFGRCLYRILISPVQQFLRENAQICIVPDKSLSNLSFPAIRSDSGTFLIEDYILTTMSSSNVYLSCTKTASGKRAGTDEPLLSVGITAFDQAAFPNLPPLPGAEKEANSICKYYRDHHSLIGPQAVKTTVVALMQNAAVVELATHCLVDPLSPLQSRLILAREPGLAEDRGSEADALQAKDIYNLRLPRTRLVILSACRTAIESSHKGEGAIGMARPFIVSGVPLVVATLWSVDSEATAELMIDFHRLRKEGKLPSTAEALRSAQLHALQGAEANRRRPFYWAGFVAIGGYTTF